MDIQTILVPIYLANDPDMWARWTAIIGISIAIAVPAVQTIRQDRYNRALQNMKIRAFAIQVLPALLAFQIELDKHHDLRKKRALEVLDFVPEHAVPKNSFVTLKEKSIAAEIVNAPANFQLLIYQFDQLLQLHPLTSCVEKGHFVGYKKQDFASGDYETKLEKISGTTKQAVSELTKYFTIAELLTI